AERVDAFSGRTGRKFYLIAESDLNDARLIRPREQGGCGLHGQWSDDFHHCVHTLLTGETDGYYVDFGKTEQLAKALREGFVYSGQYSEYRKRNHGNSSADRPARQFVVFSQNHDQTGNRMLGERLSVLLPYESLKLAAGIVLLSPFIPLLFMGEEYAEEAPFLYFISHNDPALVEAVRSGRKEEFSRFIWNAAPPDPQSAGTFMRSKITWEKRNSGKNRTILNLYRQLIALRKGIPCLSNLSSRDLDVSFSEEDRTLIMRRWRGDDHALLIFNFGKEDVVMKPDLQEGEWKKTIDSSDTAWAGPGSALPDRTRQGDYLTVRSRSFVMYQMEGAK
ncbi:MAG: DUF3459 domain-containing protein, partial [Nitrospirota bacterium]